MTKLHAFPSLSDNIFHRSLLQRAGSMFRTLLDARGSEALQPVHIMPAKTFRALQREDLAAVVVARNEMVMLPSFLRHYRQLGVTRFIVLDDQSTDGSVDYLTSQPDVDVWTSPDRFAAAAGGMAWREALFDRYGKGRWYLNLDADEYLVYDRYEQNPLPQLIETLEARKCLRLSAPMIDMYSSGAVDAADFAGADQMPWHVATHFDRSGYLIRMRRRNMLVIGGPRYRKFDLANQLIKAPLTYWDGASSLRHGIHKPMPYTRNFSPIFGVILHFKFFADFRKEVEEAVLDGQHYDDAREYKVMAASLASGGSLDFFSDISERYTGPQQLIELGFMRPVWGRS